MNEQNLDFPRPVDGKSPRRFGNHSANNLRTTEEQNRIEQGGKREVCSGVKQILHSGNGLSVDYVCS